MSGSRSCGQALAGRFAGRHSGEALLDVAPMRFQVDLGQRLQQRPLGTGQVAASFQVVGQALGLVERPGLEGGDKLALVDQAVLQGEQSEKEMAFSGGHDMAPIVGGRSGEGSGLGSRPGN